MSNWGDDPAERRKFQRVKVALLYSKILQDRIQATADDDTQLQEELEETDRQRLSRFGQDAGYTPVIIRRFLKFIRRREYKSKGRDGIETTPYEDLLNLITTLNDTKLKQVFSKKPLNLIHRLTV